MELVATKFATTAGDEVPPRVMSVASNSVTASSNVTWKLIGLAFVGELWVEVMVGVGAVLLICIVEVSLVAVLPALSVVLIFTL